MYRNKIKCIFITNYKACSKKKCHFKGNKKCILGCKTHYMVEDTNVLSQQYGDTYVYIDMFYVSIKEQTSNRVITDHSPSSEVHSKKGEIYTSGYEEWTYVWEALELLSPRSNLLCHYDGSLYSGPLPCRSEKFLLSEDPICGRGITNNNGVSTKSSKEQNSIDLVDPLPNRSVFGKCI